VGERCAEPEHDKHRKAKVEVAGGLIQNNLHVTRSTACTLSEAPRQHPLRALTLPRRLMNGETPHE